MLTIRDVQLRALGEDIRRRFELQAAADLRARFGGRIARYSDEQLLSLVREGIDRCAGYGIKLERDVGRYLEYVILYGPDFHARAWASRILGSTRLTGTERMDRIDEYDEFIGSR